MTRLPSPHGDLLLLTFSGRTFMIVTLRRRGLDTLSRKYRLVYTWYILSHTACKDEFRQNIRSHSWSVIFNFYNIFSYFFSSKLLCVLGAESVEIFAAGCVAIILAVVGDAGKKQRRRRDAGRGVHELHLLATVPSNSIFCCCTFLVLDFPPRGPPPHSNYRATFSLRCCIHT